MQARQYLEAKIDLQIRPQMTVLAASVLKPLLLSERVSPNNLQIRVSKGVGPRRLTGCKLNSRSREPGAWTQGAKEDGGGGGIAIASSQRVRSSWRVKRTVQYGVMKRRVAHGREEAFHRLPAELHGAITGSVLKIRANHTAVSVGRG
jgi:hypothetical protein